MRLFIANIPHQLEQAELNQLFTEYGQVASIKLVTDPQTGKRKGFGFIEMPVRDQALKAIDQLNGKEIKGRKLAVSEDQSPKPEKRPRTEPKEIDGNRW